MWRLILPRAHSYLWWELVVRMVLISAFIATEKLTPFWRVIQPEEEWLYSYPQTPSYVSTEMAYGVTISSVILVVMIFSGLRRNLLEFLVGLLVPSLAMPLNGFLTNSIKLTVGRPRPDYFDRCYPGVKNFNSSLPCTGDMEDIIEGRKSFPSGHSSIFFTAFTFVSLYLAGQLGVFNKRGRSQAWKLMLVLLPLVLALFAAISRTADYHHHWQDVTVGGILGATISLFVYHQYFPRVTSDVAHLSIFSHDGGNVSHSVQDDYKPSTSASLRRNNTSTSSFGYNDPVKSV